MSEGKIPGQSFWAVARQYDANVGRTTGNDGVCTASPVLVIFFSENDDERERDCSESFRRAR